MSMNLTISVDSKLLRRARDVARRQGKSLNSMIRQFLETLAGTTSGPETAEELLNLMAREGGRSGGRPFRRDDAYEGRV